MNINIPSFQNALLRWFQSNKRDLPWRGHYEPYHVWLSEIMLQQTQMERGVEYFHRWIKRFPDLHSVAHSSIEEILKYWEGLGYYARARNLHRAAKIMVDEYDGSVPSQYDDLLRLPGIGDYTAGAIASIAFNDDIVVVDANVERIFSRVFDIDMPLKSKGVHQIVQQYAQSLLPAGRARDFNQALMELGGILCTPKNPECGLCPIVEHCAAYLGNFVEDRPVKGKRQVQITIAMATGVVVRNRHIFIQQRHDNDIWGGLWEFPGGRIQESETADEAVVREYFEETGFKIEVCHKVTTVIHYFTKYKVILDCYQCRLAQQSTLPQLTAAQAYHWVEVKDLDVYGFPAGHRKFIEHVRQNCPQVFVREC